MKISYDENIDAKYIKINNNKVASTRPVNDWLIFDLNESGEVVGIEVLDASINNVNIFTDGKNVTWVEYGAQTELDTYQSVPNYKKKDVLESALAHA